jgi:integrase
MGVKVRQKIKGKGKPWWVFVTHSGQRTSKKIGTKSAANEVAKNIEAKLALGEYSFEPEKPPAKFKEYADSWIKTTLPGGDRKQSTIDDYQAIMDNHVLPVFGDMPVAHITLGKIKSFLLQKKNDGLSRSTVLHFKSAISGVLHDAFEDEVIPANPALGLRPSKL